MRLLRSGADPGSLERLTRCEASMLAVDSSMGTGLKRNRIRLGDGFRSPQLDAALCGESAGFAFSDRNPDDPKRNGLGERRRSGGCEGRLDDFQDAA